MTTNSYNQKPIPDETLFMDLRTPRFITPEDLITRWKVQSLAVTITRVVKEDTIPSNKDIDPATRKPRVTQANVMYFLSKTGDEYPRGMIIDSKEVRDAIQKATGAMTVGDLKGKRITITIGEYRDRPVLRVSPRPPTEKQTAARRTTQAPPPKPPTHNKPEPVQSDSPALARLKELAESDMITAYSNLWKAAGLDNAEQAEILQDCGGDFDAAFEKIASDYAYMIG